MIKPLVTDLHHTWLGYLISTKRITINILSVLSEKAAKICEFEIFLIRLFMLFTLSLCVFVEIMCTSLLFVQGIQSAHLESAHAGDTVGCC